MIFFRSFRPLLCSGFKFGDIDLTFLINLLFILNLAELNPNLARSLLFRLGEYAFDLGVRCAIA